MYSKPAYFFTKALIPKRKVTQYIWILTTFLLLLMSKD